MVGCLIVAFFAPFVAGQQPACAPAESDGGLDIRQIELKIVSAVEVVNVPSSWSQPFDETCTTDGTIFFRMAGQSGLSPLMSVSSDGKQIVQFDKRKITGIDNPETADFFALDSDVYMLVQTSTRPSNASSFGEIKPGVGKASGIYRFIAHFRRDGTYAGAVALDIPFNPIEFGAFPNGTFLVAGISSEHKLRLALVGPNGQFRNDLDVPRDAELMYRDNDNEMHIVSDGPNLLLFRPRQQVPIYSVAPSGEIRSVKAGLSCGFAVSDVKSNGSVWIVQSGGVTHAVDPMTGKLVARHIYPNSFGIYPACANKTGLTFLTRENDKLMLTSLAPR